MNKGARLFCFSRHADMLYPQPMVNRGYDLLFGRETLGLSKNLRDAYLYTRVPIRGTSAA
jgi:tRNA(Leu) C34 or U34 (ribose-2'-O)-methylase TrmL